MKLVAVRLVEKVTDYLQTDYPLPYRQEHATCSYPQPDKSNPCPPLIYVRSNLTLFLHLLLGLSSDFFFYRFPCQDLVCIFSLPLRATGSACLVTDVLYLLSSTRVQHIVSGGQYTCLARRIWQTVHVFSTSYLVNSTRVQHVVPGEQ